MSGAEKLPALTLLRGLVAVLRAHRVPAGAARVTARVLLEGTARGYVGHGVERIFQILDGIGNRTLRPDTEPRITRTAPATGLVDAGHGLGPPAGVAAMRLAVELASFSGAGVVGLRDGGHLGILGYYAELAARGGMVGFVLSTTSPATVGPGGGTPVLGTNPIAYAAPAQDGPLVADFSTSELSRSDLLRAIEDGRELPSGVAVDPAGRPTVDPREALAGGLLPLGGSVKGSLLALLVATFAGPLIGAPPNVDVVGTRYPDRAPHKGDLLMAIDPASFPGGGPVSVGVTRQLAAMACSTGAFYPPGSGSRRRRAAATRDGVLVSDRLRKLLEAHGCVDRPATG